VSYHASEFIIPGPVNITPYGFGHRPKDGEGPLKAYGSLRKKAAFRDIRQIPHFTFIGIMMSPSAYQSKASKNFKNSYRALMLDHWNFTSSEAILPRGSNI
jgi:hypothetical protein